MQPISPLPRRLPAPLSFLAVLALWLALLGMAQATEESSSDTTASWWVAENLTPAELEFRAAQLRARVVGLDVDAVDGSGQPRLSARLVGAGRGVPQTRWQHDLTAAGLQSVLLASQARPLELSRYLRPGGAVRYAVVMQPGDRTPWLMRLNSTALDLALRIRSGWRPVDIDAHGDGAARRYDVLYVSNAGADAPSFDAAVELTAAEVEARVNAYGGRLVKLVPTGNARYAMIQHRNSGSHARSWWYEFGHADLAAVERLARQRAARPVSLQGRSTLAGRVWDVVMIDNANAAERAVRSAFANFFDERQQPLGAFSAYLQRVGQAPAVDFNGQAPMETASALKALHHLHALREVSRGLDRLDAPLSYWYYDDGSTNAPKDRCPFPQQETPETRKITTLGDGLTRMMGDSDNRMTRSMVRRYGFDGLNATAALAGMHATRLRHNIGCAYFDPELGVLDPPRLRNETSAADLARLWAGVHDRSLLGDEHGARAEFFRNTQATLDNIHVLRMIQQEAAAVGLLDRAGDFYRLIQRWSKGGSYDLCLRQAADGQCEPGQRAWVRATVGLLGMPTGGPGRLNYRYWSHAMLAADMRIIDSMLSLEQRDALAQRVYPELLRPAVRDALATW